MRRSTAGMASVRSTERRHSARAPCSRCRKPITPVRIGLGICAPSEADQRFRDCPLDEFAAGRAGLPRSARHCTALHWQAAPAAWAWQPMLPNPAAAPHHQHVTPEQAAIGRATERRVACRRLLSQVQTVVWSGRSECQMPQCGPARLAGSQPACDGATVVLRGPVWPRMVRQHSELGADGRCIASLATSELGHVGRGQAAIWVDCTKRSLNGTGGPRT